MNFLTNLFVSDEVDAMCQLLRANPEVWYLHLSDDQPDALHIVHASLAFSLFSIKQSSRQDRVGILTREGERYHLPMNWLERRRLLSAMQFARDSQLLTVVANPDRVGPLSFMKEATA